MGNSAIGIPESSRWPGYFPISIKMLRSNTRTDFDLYLPMRGASEPVLFHKANTPFTEEARRSFIEREGRVLLIQEAALDDYRRYIEENLKDILRDQTLPVRDRAGILYDSARCAMRDMLSNPNMNEVVQRGGDLVQNMIAFQQREVWSFRCLLHVASFDYSVYTHSLNVSTFSLATALRLGFNEDELRDIALGALLHDIGKAKINQTILNFPGRLNKAQWEEIKRHPVLGYEELQQENCCNPIALDIVRHHHEKLDGSGYPDALGSHDIPLWVRISTIADVFDALTTKRVYKNAVSSFPALTIMHQEMEPQLDRDVFTLFVRIMGDQDTAEAAAATRKRLYAV